MRQTKPWITLGVVLLATAAMVVGGGVAQGQSHQNLKNTIKNQGGNTRNTVRNQSANIQTEVGTQHTTTQGVIGAAQTAIQGTVQTESTTIQGTVQTESVAVQTAVGGVESTLTSHHDLILTDISNIQGDLATLQAAVDALEPGAAGPLCGAGTVGRFVVSQDGTAVCDNDTGLFWQQTPGDPTDGTCGNNTSCTWQQAMNYCVALGGGYRLPEVKELISLVDYSVPNPGPVLPGGHPFNGVQSSGYWSAAADATFPSGAWVVFFNNGNVFTNGKTGGNFVWCARSGS